MIKALNTWTGIQDSNIYWIPVLSEFGITLGSKYKVVPTEGYLAWEYNPLRNYRLNQNMYEKDGKYYTESELCSILSNLQGSEVSLFQDKTPISDMSMYSKEVQDEFELYTLKESGELVDFITNELSFSLSNPVEILPQYSYDGSVNLILNDGLNIPRLINSRFTVTGKNTYKIIDRKGDNDTNIYDQGSQFDVDTSLFKNVNKIPKLEYLGTSNGNMKIGNYHFYFKYSDVDGNESDWVAESGLVSVFMGNTPQSVNTGIRDENSIKSVRFKLSNIDMGYSYVKVYYTRYTADVDSNLVVQAKRIDKNFLITSAGISHILITGDENETEVTLEEINSSFDVIQTAQTQCTASNRLFMANIHKTKVEYEMLAKLSLCFCPYKQEEAYPVINDGITETYDIRAKSDGYYDTQYIYDKTGYWPGELYRFGVVYLLKDGSLSPVFNIRGATKVPVKSNEFFYSIENQLNDKNCKITDVLASIDYSEENYMIIGGTAPNENAKGVVQFSEFNTCVFPVVGLQITADKRAIEELKKYVKGFFFVRQKRIPLTLSQGLVVGLDNESRTPTIPTYSGLLDSINYNNTYIETSDKNNINFVSEGFLSHYSFEVVEKDDNHNNKLWKALGIVGLVALGVALTVVTCGAGAVLFGAAVASVTPIATSILTGTLVATVVASGVTASVINYQHSDYVKMQERNARKAEAVKGRKDKIPEGYKRKEISTSRILTQDITKRYVIKDGSKNTPGAIIVPDYQVNQPFYNQFLTGDKFTVKMTFEQPLTNYLTDGYLINDYRHFYVGTYKYQTDNRPYLVNLVGVPDSCPIKMIQDNKYCARAGYPEEAYKYEFQGVTYEDTSNKIANSDIIRGNFGSFIGMYGYKGHSGDQVEIKIPGYIENNLGNYLQIRAQDTSAFYAISDRIDINNLKEDDQYLKESSNSSDFVQTFYRGDSYICQYTHRLLRNFNDPSAPYNDKIVDEKTWKQNYDPDKTEKYANINLGDVNAVQLGLWLTFNVRSSYNLNIRTVDKSHIDESIMSGNYRSFYPNYGQLASGNQKIPDSDQYNKGFSKSVSEKYYFEVPDVPYIKQEFQNRIVFSDIHINDAYKNGFRVLRTMNHKDYPMTYGSITKLIEIQNALMIIFEHGIGMVVVNNSAEHPSQILSDLKVISDTYGSQWKDSIIKTPSGIYGVDTVAKKIWRVKEGQIELISDMHVQEFLNQNITLSERELTPTLGIRNVKTVYNAFKHDIMFTFYDSLYETSEKAWNLCWNEILGIFTTFYSWIPSDMQNIDNIPFSFNRDTVKSISKLGISNHDNDFSEGVTLSNNVLYLTDSGFEVKNKSIDLIYLNQSGEAVPYEFDLKALKRITDKPGFIGFIYLDKRLPDNKSDYKITYELLRDNQANHKKFAINTEDIILKNPIKTLHRDLVESVSVSYLTLTEPNANFMLSELYYRNKENHSYADIDDNKVGPGDPGYNIELPIFKNKLGKRITLPKELQINPDKIVRYLNIKATVAINTNSSLDYAEYGSFESSVAITTQHNLRLLSTDFWKHGQAGLIDICDKTYPTYWYGQQHPFEFECVVVDDPSVHKIFTNLELVANKTKPESFHYEVVGDVYDFSEDKPTMYFRQEALKALYQYNGYDIEYNPNFLEIEPKQHNRSADLPKYYYRWDTVNEIYDCYKRFSDQIGFNYNHLAGAEIVYYPTRNEFRIWNHAEAIDVDSLNQDFATSVIKANCRYLEDKWLVSINPIVVTYKNEVDKSKVEPGTSMFSKDAFGVYKYSSWVDNANKTAKLPPISIQGTKTNIKSEGDIRFPGDDPENPTLGKDNALYGLYNLDSWNKGDWKPIDPVKHSDRRETDVRGKFMKVRIRYSGEELAIIDFLNTIYQISFA